MKAILTKINKIRVGQKLLPISIIRRTKVKLQIGKGLRFFTFKKELSRKRSRNRYRRNSSWMFLNVLSSQILNSPAEMLV